jgi:hypothetical protein
MELLILLRQLFNFNFSLFRKRQMKGKYTRLVGRHANYNIGHRAADRWIGHMEAAMKEHSILRKDDEARRCLANHFRYTGKFGTAVIGSLYSSRHVLKCSFSAIASKAHYIVVASQFMRPDQVRFSLVMLYSVVYLLLPFCAAATYFIFLLFSLILLR